MGKPWKVIHLIHENIVHIIPVGDSRQHAEMSSCICMTSVEDLENGGKIIKHTAFDGREWEEWATRTSPIEKKRQTLEEERRVAKAKRAVRLYNQALGDTKLPVEVLKRIARANQLILDKP